MQAQQPITLLLVDDEPRNLDALAAILDDPGYRLITASDANTALRLLLEHDVAAMVLDIKMPGVSGFELAQLIKGTRRFREIPILFLTAYLLEDQDMVAGYGAGAVDYLTKPVNPQVLRHKVAVFADLFRKTRALAELNETLEVRVQERTAELECSEAALRKASEQKDAFLAILAHELRNPLTPLRTGLDYLLQQPSPTAEVGRVLGTMDRQLGHMVRLIDDLLDVARITRGALNLKPEPFDLSRLVEEAIRDLEASALQRKLRVTHTIESGVWARADATRIRQIVGNLLDNAAKYSPAGAHIEVSLQEQDKQAVIQVKDSGSGIPPDQLEAVFDMFTRVERSDGPKSGGLGLGLAIARQLAEMHGGRLRAESAGEGQGSTFTLVLPTIAPPSTAPEASDNHAPSRGELSVVVIEDNVDIAELLAMSLEMLGHKVRVAHEGVEGIELVRSVRPAVVLCDIGLPDIDGLEVCRRVKQLSLDVSPRMIALTGWGADTDRERTKDAGFERHLVKPVALEQLAEVMSATAN
jgi:signal transduction histidine kinase